MRKRRPTFLRFGGKDESTVLGENGKVYRPSTAPWPIRSPHVEFPISAHGHEVYRATLHCTNYIYIYIVIYYYYCCCRLRRRRVPARIAATAACPRFATAAPAARQVARSRRAPGSRSHACNSNGRPRVRSDLEKSTRTTSPPPTPTTTTT